MKNTPYRYLIPAAVAVLAAVPAAAEEPTLEQLTKLENKIEVGIAGIGDESRRMGMFNGMSGSGGVYPIFDASILNRDEATGTWFRFSGEGLGSEGGQVRLEHEKQGAWNYFIEGGRTTYANPRIINTSKTGLGDTLNINNGTTAQRRNVELEMHRDKLLVGGGMKLKDGYAVNFSAREERKTGMRQWGVQGFAFAVEPIEFTTQEYQGTVSYTGKQLQMQGGYLGSIFQNQAERLIIQNSSNGDASLPLNNMMHQLFVNGGYNFTPTTRGTFNASYGRVTQTEDFFARPTQAGNTRTDLGGKVDNTLLNLGLTSRPVSDLSTRVKMRYEERNDNTPIAPYVSGSTSRTGYNIPFSRGTANTDAEATYRLPMDFKLIGGIGYEHWDRTSPAIRHASWRTKTDEASIRVTLRRPLLETLSGSIGYVHSERYGSHYQPTGTGGFNATDPILWANRSRDKGRLTLEWVPTPKFSMQFLGEGSLDNYPEDDRRLGPQNGEAYFASLDANYKISDDWDMSGWVSFNQTMIKQRAMVSSTFKEWDANLRHVGKAAGVTLKGKVTDSIKAAADLQRSEDTSVHGIMNGGASLPDIEYRQWLLTLTGDYAIEENKGVKLKYGISHTDARDWTWQNMVYNDGTRVKIPDEEVAHFVGLSFYYRW